MEVNAKIISESNGQPVTDGMVYYTNDAGNMAPLSRVSPDGSFRGFVPDTSPAIMVVAPGYAPQVIDVGETNDVQQVQLKPAALAPDPTLKIKNTTLSAVPPLVWIGGAVALIYGITEEKKGGKVSGESSGQDYSKYILPLGLLAGVAILLNKFGLFGNTGTSDNNAIVEKTISQGTAATLAELKSKGIEPTLTQAQAASISNNIFNAGLYATAESSGGVATIFNELGLCRNDADIYLVMQKWGARKISNSQWSLCSLANINCEAVDLESFVTAVLNNVNAEGLTLHDLNYQLSTGPYGQPTQITYQF